MADFRNFVNRDAEWARFLMHRRDFLRLAAYAGAGLIVSPFSYLTSMAEEQVSPGKFAFDTLQERWGPERLNRFLELITDEDRLNLKKVLGLLPEEATTKDLRGVKSTDVHEILKQLLWVCSNKLAYWFRKEWEIDYHNWVVSWCAQESAKMLGRKAGDLGQISTFCAERRILLWCAFFTLKLLPKEEREKVLGKLGAVGKVKDVTDLPAEKAFDELPKHEIFKGFKLYDSVRTLMSHYAEFRGIALPQGADRVAIPLWRLLGVVLTLLPWLWKQLGPNFLQALQFVVELHDIKSNI